MKTIRRAKDGVVAFNLTDWEELHEYIAAEADHHRIKKTRKELDALWEKIQHEIFNKHDDGG